MLYGAAHGVWNMAGTLVSEVKTIYSILDVCRRGDDSVLRGDAGILNSHLSSVTLEKCHSHFSLRTISDKMKRLNYINKQLPSQLLLG